MDTTAYLKAKEEMLTATGEDCQHFFYKNNLKLEAAYYELLNKNLPVAKKIFQSIQAEDIRAHWGYFITSLIGGKIEGYPSYFELRNFYEVDLQLFFTYYLGEYIEEICKYTDWLSTINPEIYKYTGRSFLKNQYTDIGIKYLEQAKEKFFNDPELHYLLAEVNMRLKKYPIALKDITNCLNILPNYYPAIEMQKKIQSML